MSGMIVSAEEVREEEFRRYMAKIKCPFRIKKVMHGNDVWEEMMPCQADCAALINRADKSAWSCLRMMNIQYPLKYEHGIEIFHGLDKEED